MQRAILIADPYETFAAQLAAIANEAGWAAISCHTFELARQALEATLPDVLVTNVRLGLYNGIQLCYLIKRLSPDTPVVVYAAKKDIGSAMDAQQACGLFERQSFVPHSLPSYLAAVEQQGDAWRQATATLPDRDRRNPHVVDRREFFRGGRRATDLAVLHQDRLPPPQAMRK